MVWVLIVDWKAQPLKVKMAISWYLSQKSKIFLPLNYKEHKVPFFSLQIFGSRTEIWRISVVPYSLFASLPASVTRSFCHLGLNTTAPPEKLYKFNQEIKLASNDKTLNHSLKEGHL